MAESASFRSVVALWLHRVHATPDARGLIGRVEDGWRTWTWAECGVRVRQIALGLTTLGVEPGEAVGILCRARVDWVLADLGILAAGGVTVGIHPTLPPADCQAIVQDAGLKRVFVEDAGLAEKLSGLDLELIQLGGRPPAGRLALRELERMGRDAHQADDAAFEERAAAIGSEDLATIVYTSGTTGTPRGVELTHDNLVYQGEATDKLGLLSPADLHYCFLSLSHAFGRGLMIASIRGGVPTVLDGDLSRLGDNLRATRPTIMAAVPRTFERFQAAVLADVHAGNVVRRKLFFRALDVGKEVGAIRQRGQEPSGALAVRWQLADRTALQAIRDRLGGRLRCFISGAAPLSEESAIFMQAVGMPVLEGYGLTESTAACVVNPPGDRRIGSVGRPMWGVELKLADDGEVLLRGRGVMRGYHGEGHPDVIDDEGWLHTGDVGTIEDGYLYLTDRKQDLILTTGGQKVAPQRVEGTIDAHCPHISRVVVFGDRKPHLVALITLHPESISAWGEMNDLRWSTPEELAELPQVRALIQRAVDDANAELASHESVRNFHILPRDLRQGEGELTPTLKVRRLVVAERYQAELRALYGESEA